jgi:hypothetical protein
MEELFGIDGSEVLVNLEFPLVQEVSFCEALNKSVDPIIAVLGLSDYIGANITNLVRIIEETTWQRGLMAPGWEQVDILASFCELQDRLVKFII